MPRFVQPRVLLLFASLAALSAVRAADPQPVPEPIPVEESDTRLGVRERVLRMTEFLDTILPGTLGAKNLTLHFNPKFADIRHREFIRYPVEVRYGATDRLELIGGLTPFGPNPINDGRDHRWGPGEAKFGARYDLVGKLLFYDAATVGIENRVPLGKPPIEINDHYTHVRPFIAVSRHLRSIRFTTFYTNISYDRSVELTDREPPPPEVDQRHIFEVAPGLLYKPAEFGYFGEYRFRHIRDPYGWHLGHEARLGTIWDVPVRRTAAWRLPGKWQVELAYKFNMEEGREKDHGVSARVRWRTTLREVLNHDWTGKRQ